MGKGRTVASATITVVRGTAGNHLSVFLGAGQAFYGLAVTEIVRRGANGAAGVCKIEA